MATFDEIFAAEYSRAVRFAHRRCGLPHDVAEQVASDAFVDLSQALQHGEVIENPVAWLRGSIHQQHANHVRHITRTKRGGELTRLPELFEDPNLAVDHHEFETVDAVDALQAVWHRLTEIEQKIAETVFMQELTHTQAADKLGISVRTVERRVHQIRTRLRTFLSSP